MMKCPNCGAEELSRVQCNPVGGWAVAHPCITFKCGSILHDVAGGPFEESKQCLRRQLAQAKADYNMARRVATEIVDRVGNVLFTLNVYSSGQLHYHIKGLLLSIDRQKTAIGPEGK